MRTWGNALDGWKNWLRTAGASPGTIKIRLSYLHRAARVFPDPWAVTLADLSGWLASKDWGPEARKSARASLRGFYNWAMTMRIITSSPAEGLPPIRVPAGEPRPASDDVILDALETATPRVRLMIRLGALMGLRRAEIAQVATTDVENQMLRVHGKGGKDRVVPIPDALRRELYRAPAGWLFPNGHGGHLGAGHVGKLITRALPPGITPHMLRHAAAGAWHEEIDITDIRPMLGHASLTTTQRYVPARQHAAIRAVNTAARRLAS